MWVQQQLDLNMIGVGSSGQIYEVDGDTVLKAGRVYQPPDGNTSRLDIWHYVSESIFHFELIENERKVFQQLERNPHPNIAEPIDITRPEGIYIRRYTSISEMDKFTRPQRVSLYLSLLRGLSHLHSLEIAHSDLRVENVLFDIHGEPIICDFSASAAFGQPNPAAPSSNCPVPINGLSKLLSGATDRFAFASLMFRLETGAKPALSFDPMALSSCHTLSQSMPILVELSRKHGLGLLLPPWRCCAASSLLMSQEISQDPNL
ncbi:hypothetical protein F66182_5913 [Fusarium sp. NRRL 66182]|nr:hypothetical protein F66182_5913 [Fusarium sp. NRRL 66182]